MAEAVAVREHKRQLKSGQVVTVKAHKQSRDLVADSLSDATDRPPLAAQPGKFANGRSTPDSPVIAKARMRIVEAKIAAVRSKTTDAPAKEPESDEGKQVTQSLTDAPAEVQQVIGSFVSEVESLDESAVAAKAQQVVDTLSKIIENEKDPQVKKTLKAFSKDVEKVAL